ncbi:MAG: hypothetical protein K9G76_10465 [Bacteroidales bacterium]|nr:hypothetical protein [Bacteroidales bacterium]MCF8405777.1 hypothetical protein [Bacteroidales bacterium]
MNATEILIENIKEEIPSLLTAKLETFDIKNLEEVLSIDIDEFSQRRGIGKTVIDKLCEFQKQIRNDIERFANIQIKNTKTHFLPVNDTIISSSNFLDVASEVITDYLNLLLTPVHRGIINHLYGLNNADKYIMSDLAHYYSLTRERIRQLKSILLEEIQRIFKGEFNTELRCQIRKSVSAEFTEIQKFLSTRRVFSFDELIETFRDKYSCRNASDYKEIIDLLIDVFGFSKCGKVESNFTIADIIVVDGNNKKTFLNTAEKTLRLLKRKIVPLNEMQAVIEIKKAYKTLQNTQIIDALYLLPEIEILDSNDQTFFQVKFEYLSSAADRAYRVLLEKGDEMYIDNIVSEINHRLAHTGTSKIYDRHSLAIAADKRFVSMAKSGFWTLKEWNKNIEKLEVLVKNALYKLNKPSTYEEIYQIISIERPNIKEKSVRAITGRDCLKVVGNKWILPEWKQKYSSLAFLSRKKRLNTTEPEHRIEQRTLIIKYLDKKKDKRELASKIIKELGPLDKRFSRVSFYKLFEQEEYFIKDDSSILSITLRSQDSNVKISIDQYHWSEVSKKLERDISGAFNHSTSPNYSQSLADSIQLFYEFLLKETSEKEFQGLPERILGNMNKYYFDSTDNIDKLNFLKQFLTSTDPLLKKILWFVNQTDYNWIKTHKKGLGDIIEKLNKLDPTKERFKDERTARAFKFGKQIQAVYYYRNNDTHGANDWTVAELTKTISNCFTFYIFSCAEYYSELKIKINAA